MTCRLCGGQAALFHKDPRREYLRCSCCDLVFVPERLLPDASECRRRYDLHQNDPEDPGYRAFLSRLTGPLAQRLAPGSRGLDYGCGPGPTVSVLLGLAGHEVADFDPVYRPDAGLLCRKYDFVTCTEVAEHFLEPLRDWTRLFSLLVPGGRLAVMTQLHDGTDFARWHYKEDPTHVAIHGRRTLEWLSRRFAAPLELLPRSVGLFRAPGLTAQAGQAAFPMRARAGLR